MRIEFANAEQPGLEWTHRELRIGSAADNDLVLGDPGVAEHHLRLIRDVRGMVMIVESGAGRVYLNARKVRERALLRAGDCIGVGDTLLRLACPQARELSGKIDSASLRAVAGPLSGRAQAMTDRLDLGNGGPWSLGLGQSPDASLSFVRKDHWIHLHAARFPDAGNLCVNGVPAREIPLHDGDQIAIGPHRFVLDACVIPAPEEPSDREDEQPLPEDTAGPRREVWWLVVTAAALALVIATLLFVRL